MSRSTLQVDGVDYPLTPELQQTLLRWIDGQLRVALPPELYARFLPDWTGQTAQVQIHSTQTQSVELKMTRSVHTLHAKL